MTPPTLAVASPTRNNRRMKSPSSLKPSSSCSSSSNNSNKVKDLITKFSELSATSDTFEFPFYELTPSTSKTKRKGVAGKLSTTNHRSPPDLVQCGDSSTSLLSTASNSTKSTDAVDDEPSIPLSYFDFYKQSNDVITNKDYVIHDNGVGASLSNDDKANDKSDDDEGDEEDDDISIQNIEEFLTCGNQVQGNGQEEFPSKRESSSMSASTVRFAEFADVYDIERLSESISNELFYNEEEYSQFIIEACYYGDDDDQDIDHFQE